MTQEDKELLLKDLSARLPYGIKVKTKYYDGVLELISIDVNGNIYVVRDKEYPIEAYVEDTKPYLFPMSSMTEEQKDEFDSLYTYDALIIEPQIKLINWCYENHFDINGLIPKGLALDATGLNIY